VYDDFDGLCPDGSGGYFALNREPGVAGQVAYILRLPAGQGSTTVLSTTPLTSSLDGVNDVARIGAFLYSADFLTRRLHRFSAATGTLESSIALSPSIALNSVTTIPAFFGDADHNLVVNFSDITSVLSNFGTSYPPGTVTGQGDADASDGVNFGDVTAVLANFGSTCP
jgi:hypothetical protein